MTPCYGGRVPDRGLRRALGVRDLLLFYVVTTFSLRWMATAAASGPSALVIWLIGAVGLFVPLVFTTIELSTRFPQEGGLYVWSREVFGPLAGFMTGWIYWCSNLSYLPSLLYFAAGNFLFVFGDRVQALASSPAYFIAASLLGLALTAYVNVIGLDVGKWLNNAGGIASWIVAAALIGCGALAFARFGSATAMPPASFVPSTGLRDVIFWSTIAFAYSGVESASTMAEEIANPRRTVPRAIAVAAVSITVLYLAGTFAILVAVPAEQISGIQGIMQALDVMSARVGAAWATVPLALMVFVSSVGGVSGWFAAVGRLPFVAGIDRFLPAAFGRVHPVWRTPHVSLLAQAAVAAVVVILGQAGTTVRGAYDVLVSMSIIGAFIPFLFMFAAVIRVQRMPASAEVLRIPGGRPAAVLLGSLGFATTLVAIVLACVPSADDTNPGLAVGKIVGLSLTMTAAGAAVYAVGRHHS